MVYKDDPKVLSGEYVKKILVKLLRPHSAWGRVSIWIDEFDPSIHKK